MTNASLLLKGLVESPFLFNRNRDTLTDPNLGGASMGRRESIAMTMCKQNARCGSFIVIAAGLILSFASTTATAGCNPAYVPRWNKLLAREPVLIARLRAGDCSALPEWKRLLAEEHSILLADTREPNGNVTFNYKHLTFPKCQGGAQTAQAVKRGDTTKPSSRADSDHMEA
jgi:hypothetical protein